MKKIIAALAACLIMTFVFASCSDPLASSNNSDTKSSSSSAGQDATEETTKAAAKKTYSDSFEDLKSYMQDKGILIADSEELKKNTNDTKLPNVSGVDYKYGYEYIGAVKGEKYTNNGVIIELYEFEEGKQNDTVDSVKKNGTFTLFDKEVTAYLTSSDKYMMIYSDKNVKDGDTESDAYKTMQTAVKAFEAFKPGK